MDRRQFLSHSGVGVAAIAIGGVAGRTEGAIHQRHHERDSREAVDYAGDSHGMQRIWWSAETDQRVAALTFDDGPHEELTRRVLAVLAAHRTPATFFMIGENAVAHRNLVADVVSAGHEVANHTWSHGRVVQENLATVRNDIVRGADALHSITGQRTKWLRPPRGMIDGAVLSGARAARNELVLWSMTRGGPAVQGGAAILGHLVDHLHPGAIVDLHDGTGVDPKAKDLLARRDEELAVLPSFLAGSIAAGYRFVTVSELVGQVAGAGQVGATHAVTHAERAVEKPDG